jgi:hypothetical protein
MKKHNNPQWGDSYPADDMVREDCEVNGNGYVVCDCEQKIVAAFAVCDNSYYYEDLQGEWLNDKPYKVIKRVALTKGNLKIAQFILDWALQNFDNIKADTGSENIIVQKILEKNGFIRCGIIPRFWGTMIAYQRYLGEKS